MLENFLQKEIVLENNLKKTSFLLIKPLIATVIFLKLLKTNVQYKILA